METLQILGWIYLGLMLGSIGGVIFIGFTASLIWFDYGIDWDTYKFKNKSKNKRK